MGTTITISPVSRIEGHAAITIRLDEAGQVAEARLHVREFRGFESFCLGRPFWEMPTITARVCGICPVSHALAAAMAGERIMGVDIPPAAQHLRRILSLAQLILSHSLSFFHLSAPDIVLGLDSDPTERNIVGLARHRPEVIRKGIRLRQIGQEIVNLIGGGRLHPEHIVAGGMGEPLGEAGRDAIAALLPEARELTRFALDLWQERSEGFRSEMGPCGDFPSLFLGLVGVDGCLDHYEGRLTFADAAGGTVGDLAPERYAAAIRETVTHDSYLKPTECAFGGDRLYRVGPLARLSVAPFAAAPQAEQARTELLGGRRTATASLDYHQARLIEMLYAVERIAGLVDDPLCVERQVLARAGGNAAEGVGVTEAPRGTLIHHYRVDRDGLLTGVNLVVATAHNSRAMDLTITDIARHHLQGGALGEGLLNRVEHGIRLYDPCLSCATHAVGRMGMTVVLRAANGKVLDRAVR
ncbi:Ni/Fe hydrogenase subunit alpha [Oryzomonas sagensis]|uniref:Ni/Fe hydrogenase subunit alpha n=1 Tax=Oryzomonas sagensis TaxID=2603857 RepID=A0ABQ6TSW7_9BACT|nr:Ni/Fe hydrogenase subunit alpha [Oryzomonas sagensis]KAB0671879.1 Ni/Fe hydrogenase subunit alpha [Oryzomonas sagensis]